MKRIQRAPYALISLWGVIGIVAVVAIFSRVFLLRSVPTSLANDEMVYVINAQFLARTGSDISGTWNPWSLTPMHPMFAELPTLFLAPFMSLPLEPIVAAKLPFVFMSLLVPVILGGISYEIFRDKKTALFTVFIALFNPWLWQFGRMGFDSYWGLFFLCLGAWAFLRFPRLSKLWSIILFTIGFYQYQGYKLVLVPWVGVFAVIASLPAIKKGKQGSWKLHVNWKKVIAPVLVFLSACCVFAFYVLVQLPRQSSSTRLSSVLTPNSQEIVEAVNESRHLSIASRLTPLTVNRYTVWTEELLMRYAKIYSPTNLFLKSQDEGFNVWSHGNFYGGDALLILLGILILWKRDKRLLLGLFSFGLLFCVLPAVIGNGDSYVFRPSLSIPLLLLLAGVGGEYLRKSLPEVLFYGTAAIYIIGIVNFAYTYFVRYPVYSSTSGYFADKILAEYVRRSDPNQQIVIYTREPEFTYWALLFYNDWLKEEDVREIQKSYRDGSHQIKNVHITTGCVPTNLLSDGSITNIVRFDTRVCEPVEEPPTKNVFLPIDEATNVAIGTVRDSGQAYFVYNDRVCKGQRLPDYLNITHLDSFEVQKLNLGQFCQTWLIRK